jgi:hypothetical protein
MPLPVHSSSSEPNMATMHATLALHTAESADLLHSSIESITLQAHNVLFLTDELNTLIQLLCLKHVFQRLDSVPIYR